MPASSTPAPQHPAGPLEGLLMDVAEGSREAFESLYRATAPRLHGICLHLLANRTEAEDLLQDVFTSIWHKAAQFDAARSSAMAWMSMITRNRAIDQLRARPARSRLGNLDLADEVADEGATPQQDTEHHEQGKRLQQCMNALDARRRDLIRAAFFDGSTYEELAIRSASPLGSVKSWIRRGLIQLRACIGQ